MADDRVLSTKDVIDALSNDELFSLVLGLAHELGARHDIIDNTIRMDYAALVLRARLITCGFLDEDAVGPSTEDG